LSVSSNFGENSLFKCEPQPKIAKISLKPTIFNVIASSACYDEQQVCVYVQPF